MHSVCIPAFFLSIAFLHTLFTLTHNYKFIAQLLSGKFDFLSVFNMDVRFFYSFFIFRLLMFIFTLRLHLSASHSCML